MSLRSNFQDEFLRSTLLSPNNTRRKSFSVTDAIALEPDFEATDSDLEASDPDVLSESGDDFFHASDGEQVPQSAKRDYATRRAEDLMFLGRPVCLKAGCRLIGIGQKVLQRLRSGQCGYKGQRAPAPKHPTFGFSLRGSASEKWPSVLMFLWLIYHSSAEHMPDSSHSLRKPSVKNLAESETPFGEGVACDDDEVDRRINGFMTSLHRYRSDVDVHLIGPGTFKGERRELP